jgi:sec-independent protein translocase protein TatC
MANEPERTDEERTSDSGGMPFLDHLEELRWRLLKALLSVIITAVASLYFGEELLKFILAPAGDIKLHFTEVTGSLYAYLKVSLLVGVMASLPIIFYQLWAFVSPGLYRREKSIVLPLVLTSTAMFLAGAAFCYYIVLPLAMKFLISFGSELLNPIITVNSYLSFAGFMLLAFGMAFELPVAAFILARMGIVSPTFLAHGRRYALVIILIAAAVLTPTPDVFTQLMLAVPLYILYEISIIVARFVYPKERGV